MVSKLNRSQLQAGCYGHYPVTLVSNFFVNLESVTLGGRCWVPSLNVPKLPDASGFVLLSDGFDGRLDENFPTVLEYIPYGKDVCTAERDALRHPWFASHGYLAMRIDVRGSGVSSGDLADEYTQEELDDCVELINWISSQSWSNGCVGMFGKSWGGFNGLQLAAVAPECLKAVISLYSTDNRYTDDVHYIGGCVMSNEMPTWSSYMLVNRILPTIPHGSKIFKNWNSELTSRLNSPSCIPWHHIWMRHPLYDEYWQHGSICENTTRIRAAILAIGGWADMYSDAPFRMLGRVKNLCAIVGNWPHEWPDFCSIGPNIDFLGTCRQWFDRHLKRDTTPGGALPAALRVFVNEPPSGGRWLQYATHEAWDAAREEHQWYLGASGTLRMAAENDDVSNATCDLFFDVWSSFGAGEVLAFDRTELAGDQAIADKAEGSAMFETSALVAPVTLLGFGRLELSVSSKGTTGLVFARLCDVSPKDYSTLVTSGVHNLTHSADHKTKSALKPGEPIDVQVHLKAAAWTFAAGHSMRVTLSSSYWPVVWNPPHTDLRLHFSASPRLYLFVSREEKEVQAEFDRPKPLTSTFNGVTETPPKRKRVWSFDERTKELKLTYTERYSRQIKLPEIEIQINHRQEMSAVQHRRDSIRCATESRIEWKQKGVLRMHCYQVNVSGSWCEQDGRICAKDCVEAPGVAVKREWLRQMPLDEYY